ncbi:MAG: hypothetical protein HUK40_01465 [Desulfobacter sp.]|nr:hypothetical protein [Desulfobacter sp.]WDP85507.1 MAG: hypothetical protein HUN05_10480 [Desulfobacter sp.]
MTCIRKILPNLKDFKAFWKKEGPFKFALTANEYPPVLLEPEEWIFSNDKIALLKELMQFSKSKMAFVKAPFNPANKAILRPSKICEWKINHFPQEWNSMVCDAFVPEGHLTHAVMEELGAQGGKEDKAGVEAAFFARLEHQLETMGYLWLCPGENSKFAAVNAYLKEWEQDETEAGLF